MRSLNGLNSTHPNGDAFTPDNHRSEETQKGIQLNNKNETDDPYKIFDNEQSELGILHML